MKLFFISLFLFISYSLFGSSNFKYLQEYVKNEPIPVSYGLKPLDKTNIFDFSTLTTASLSSYPYYKLEKVESEAIVPFIPVNEKWYTEDFSSDPFNGIVDILIMGEPLPSTYVTLFLASILAFTVAKYNKLHNKAGFQEIS
jgi:hypothetical protein